jgi:heme-degrading monooxygenase HmoA
MFARVTTNQIKPEQIEAAVRTFREQVGELSKKMTGFKGSYLLVERQTGKIVGVALWDKKEDLDASERVAADIRSRIRQASAASSTGTVEVYEVAAQF